MAAEEAQVHEVGAECGIVVPQGDDRVLEVAILGLGEDRPERSWLCAGARKYAVKNIDSVRVHPEIEQALVSCREGGLLLKSCVVRSSR